MRNKALALMAVLIFGSAAYSQEVDFRFSGVPGKQNRTDYLYRTSIRFGLPVQIKGFTIRPYGSWETWAAYIGSGSGEPFRDTYGFGADIEWRGFYVDYYHYCSHPVISEKGYQDKYPTPKAWDQQLTTVSIGYRARFNTIVIWK